MRAIIIAAIIFYGGSADAQEMNFPDRHAIVLNNAPFLELSGYKFSNEYSQGRFRLITDLAWENKGKKPITAFEVVILHYDPFNRPIRSGGAWLVTGTNSGDWSPLEPGERSADGLQGFEDDPVFTSIVFVRAARMADGSVWMFDQEEVEAQIKNALPRAEIIDLETAGREETE